MIKVAESKIGWRAAYKKNRLERFKEGTIKEVCPFWK
jgi:hypothetical protein